MAGSSEANRRTRVYSRFANFGQGSWLEWRRVSKTFLKASKTNPNHAPDQSQRKNTNPHSQTKKHKPTQPNNTINEDTQRHSISRGREGKGERKRTPRAHSVIRLAQGRSVTLLTQEGAVVQLHSYTRSGVVVSYRFHLDSEAN